MKLGLPRHASAAAHHRGACAQADAGFRSAALLETSEAGGVLLGRHLLDSHDVVVDEVSTPQSSDRRSRFAFFRSSKHEQVAATTVAGREQHLGLSRCSGTRTPSATRCLAVSTGATGAGRLWDTYEGDRLFFPIVGTDCVRIWTLSRRGAFRELKLEDKNAKSKGTDDPTAASAAVVTRTVERAYLSSQSGATSGSLRLGAASSGDAARPWTATF